MARNEFHKDAFILLKKVAKEIADEELTNDQKVIENVLFFAIGIEKLLKAMIYDINPLFILETPDFKNAVPLLYDSQIKDKSEIAKNPNEDVIAFHSSVMRATTFSKAVLENKNTLMKLKNARDIIVHHNFNKLDVSELKILLQRDFYPLLSSFSDEHNFGGQTNFFNNLHSKLARISSALQNDIQKQIRLKLEASSSHWDTIKGVNTFDKRKCEHKTAEMLSKDIAFPFECPSCNNYGVVFTSPVLEFDTYRNEMRQTGSETKAFKCYFCDLEVTDYKELDFLKVKPDTAKKLEIINLYNHLEENTQIEEQQKLTTVKQ